MDWKQLSFENNEPWIIVRDGPKKEMYLHTNIACREIFNKPNDLDLHGGLDPDIPETNNEWILEQTGKSSD